MVAAVRALVPMIIALLSFATAAAAPRQVIADDGFGRPERLDVIPAGADLRVAIAGGGDGPRVVWEDGAGLRWRPAARPTESEPVVASRGVRDLAAGSAGGDPVLAWAERDLADGRTRYAWRWRGETRTLFHTRQPLRIRLVAGGERPELLVATPLVDGFRMALHDWDGTVRESEPRPLTVVGLDALRVDDAVHLGWLEGSDDVVLGSVERSWSAFLARWPDGADRPDPPAELGRALRVADADVVRLAAENGTVHAMWPGPDGVLHVTGPGGRRAFEPGAPLGRLDGSWTWLRGAEVRRPSPEGGHARTVLLLPAAPERVAAAEEGGVTVVAWSSGRYLGGLEVWAATDAEPYRPRTVERLAAAMGWDPWRPWSAAGGHLLLSLLTAVVGAAALTPLWWLATTFLGRRGAVRTGVAALEGSAVAVASIVLLLVVAGARATLEADQVRALLGGPLLILAAAAVGTASAWGVVRRQDVEPSFARLTAAWIAGGAMLFVLAFGTLQAWQTVFAA